MKLKNRFFQFLKKLSKLNREENNISYSEAIELIKDNIGVIWLDVRSKQEYEEGHLNGAINIPLYELRANVNDSLPKNSIIIVYCQSGIRSKRACQLLTRFGV